MRAEAKLSTSGPSAHIGPVLAFLQGRTPEAWVEQAVCDIDTLLLDHASLELKAAQQAQKLINRYGASDARGLSYDFRRTLVYKMAQLAREELRHFEQVVALIDSRGCRYAAISPSRYAAGLHELARKSEPGRLVDSLIIGAVIEARSCERFFSLIERSTGLDKALGKFYSSLLRSEARHFEDYLALAQSVAEHGVSDRISVFLSRDAELINSADSELRFLSGYLASKTSPGTALSALSQSLV